MIGDVHGHAARLRSLLHELGYREERDVWRHRSRCAVFVGDLIDRGPEQVETLEIVKAMVDAGSADIVLGNHEFNAVAWATPKGLGHCREHSEKHRGQHARFLAEVGEDSPEHHRWIEWFMTIPLWIDLGGLRVVHACWSDRAVSALVGSGLLGDGNTLTTQLVVEGTTKPPPTRTVIGSELTPYDAIEWLLKGPEVPLGPIGYRDKDGNPRYRARYAWWDPDASPVPVGAVVPRGVTWIDADGVELGPSPAVDVPAPYTDEVPVIFGHYWCDDAFDVLGPRAMCVDFSAGKGGPLAAYRWDGERELDGRKLVKV